MENSKVAWEFVQKNGPVQPSQVSSTIKTNILFASAILSELVQNKKVKITYIKRGGSPFYYVEGQERKLTNLSQYLPGKLKEAYQLINEKLVIRDVDALPWQRVALRELKDFVVPLTVEFGGIQEIFWKWYLTSNEDARNLIEKALGQTKEEVEEIQEENEKAQADEEIIKELKVKQTVLETEELKTDNIQENLQKEENLTHTDTIGEFNFFDTLLNYFSSNKMYIISQGIVRKGREFNFIVDVPSSLGALRYFVKFKNKKSISDSDLLSALEEATKNKLPVLFLSNGNLNKKAQQYLNNNVSGQLIFKLIT